MIATRSDFGKLLHEKGLDAYPAAEIGVAEGHYSLEILQWGVPRLYMVDLWEHVPSGYRSSATRLLSCVGCL
jgi:hypothetical protein